MTRDADKQLSFEMVFDWKGRVLVVIDLTDPMVDLPTIARSRSPDGRHLPLSYSRTFVEANIKIKDDGIYADLAFDPKRYSTFVPWSSIRAILQGGQVLEEWPDVPSVPPVPNPKDQVMVEILAADAPNDPNAMAAEEMKWFSSQVAEG